MNKVNSEKFKLFKFHLFYLPLVCASIYLMRILPEYKEDIRVVGLTILTLYTLRVGLFIALSLKNSKDSKL